MANIASQIKRNRQTIKRTERNRSLNSEMKTRVKRVLAAAESGDGDIDALARQAVSVIDRAAKKGVIHRNQAARRKSRLHANIERLKAASAA